MAHTAGAARPVPRLRGLDHSLAFLADPYRFIARACAGAGSDVVQARLMLQPTLCLVGAEAARLFYDKDRFTRVGAAPEPVQATLFGKGALQSLDGPDHLLRKSFFLRACTPAQVAELVAITEQTWHLEAAGWARRPPFALYGAVQEVLTRSACAWAGVPLPERDVDLRTGQLVALFDSAASGIGAHLRARRARHEAESWLVRLVEQTRRGIDGFEAGSIARAAADLRDASGLPLPARVAAVELLNVLRPTVAVSVYIVLAAHALHHHPQWKEPLARGDLARTRAFAQEVRRFYPFFPAVAARTTQAFEWGGYRFPAGVRVMLDLYGTNHDPRGWKDPGQFEPQRFLDAQPDPFGFIPQGGARAEDHHRCPGESVALALMELALRILAGAPFRVVPQDLRIRMRRMPAVPAAGFRVAL